MYIKSLSSFAFEQTSYKVPQFLLTVLSQEEHFFKQLDIKQSTAKIFTVNGNSSCVCHVSGFLRNKRNFIKCAITRSVVLYLLGYKTKPHYKKKFLQ